MSKYESQFSMSKYEPRFSMSKYISSGCKSSKFDLFDQSSTKRAIILLPNSLLDANIQMVDVKVETLRDVDVNNISVFEKPVHL